MTELNDMEKFAFDELRKVIWDDEPRVSVYPIVAEKFSLGMEEAKSVTNKAWDRWVEVYYPD